MPYVKGWERDVLPQSLAAGTFTPFLGAGASSLRSSNAPSFDRAPWKTVGEVLKRTYNELQDEESRRFLRSFAENRLRMTSDHLERFFREEAEKPQVLADNDLIGLQVELVQVMQRLTDIFGDEFVEQVPSLHNLSDCAVKFSLRERDEQAAWVKLADAVLAAKRLQSRRPIQGPKAGFVRSTRPFRIEGIYQQLLSLARLLVSSDDEALLKESGLKERDEKGTLLGAVKQNPDLALKGDLPDESLRGKLRLDMMQWLGDLFEYTLIYWIPRFPTTVELAFHLGVILHSGPPRRPELAQAAQALEAIGFPVAQEIAEYMEYCAQGIEHSGGDRLYRSFYLAIAVALCDQWDHYKEARDSAATRESQLGNFRRENRAVRSERVDEGSQDGKGGSRDAFMPIMATTNYDSGLEMIFDEFKIPYHVLFPVRSGRPDAMVPWVFRTVASGVRVPDIKMSAADQKLPGELVGPVVVKLHGAPTQVNADDGNGGGLAHKVVLSEREYLDALQEGSSALRWFESEIFQPLDEIAPDGQPRTRSVWFLGYSIADWNVRLRLYSHLRAHERQRRSLSAVNRDYDPFRQAILGPLNVQLCHGDLMLVRDAILQRYRGLSDDCSARVRKLIAALADCELARSSEDGDEGSNPLEGATTLR